MHAPEPHADAWWNQPAPEPYHIDGVDTYGSPYPFGLCRQMTRPSSHWCSKGQVQGGPSRPHLKYGRQTVYTLDDPNSIGACCKPLGQAGDLIEVAPSSIYITRACDPPACGQCVCVRVVDADRSITSPNPSHIDPYKGTVMKGIVNNLCPECEDDHIDIAQTDALYRHIPKEAMDVGVWVVEWNFVSCDTDCNTWF